MLHLSLCYFWLVINRDRWLEHLNHCLFFPGRLRLWTSLELFDLLNHCLLLKKMEWPSTPYIHWFHGTQHPQVDTNDLSVERRESQYIPQLLHDDVGLWIHHVFYSHFFSVHVIIFFSQIETSWTVLPKLRLRAYK